MPTSNPRRLALVAVASGLAVSAVALGAAPVGATATHRVVPAKTKYIAASLNHVTVAPHSSDAWAIGSQTNSKEVASPLLLERVNGHWSRVAVKYPGTFPQPQGIAAGSPKSVWIVGSASGKKGGAGMILRSTGGAFKSALKLPVGSNVTSIAASSATNAWAIGSTLTGALAIHWNGHKWKSMKLPKVSGSVIDPDAVSTSGPDNAWFLSVGESVTATHWNGHAFSNHTFAPPTDGAFSVIATGSPTNTWIGGYISVVSGTTSRQEALTYHWKGGKFVRVTAPSPAYESILTGITAVGSHTYAVGLGNPKVFHNGVEGTAFALQFTGGHWKNEHVTQHGKVSAFEAVGASADAVVAVGVWSVAPECTANYKSIPLVESLSSGSWHSVAVPELRFGSAQLRMPLSERSVPHC
jgi:hypothetical protein